MKDNLLPEESVCKAAREVESGLIHANLGGGVYKQRVARPGQGKSGGFRTILLFRAKGHTFFILGFAKNERDSLSAGELDDLRLLAKETLNYDDQGIQRAVQNGTFEEICRSEKL